MSKKIIFIIGLITLFQGDLFSAEAEPVDLHQQLIIAASSGDLSTLNNLLTIPGFNVNTANSHGATALMVASFRGHADCVERLIPAVGAGVNAVEANGMTALMFAAFHGHADCVERLIPAVGTGVNAADIYGRTPLMLASSSGHVDCIEHLIPVVGAGIDMGDRYGATALMIASFKGHFNCLQRLVIEGANVNRPCGNGRTVLMYAASTGNVRFLQYLLAVHGIAVNAVDIHDCTALMLANRNGHLHCAQLLRNKLRTIKQSGPALYS